MVQNRFVDCARFRSRKIFEKRPADGFRNRVRHLFRGFREQVVATDDAFVVSGDDRFELLPVFAKRFLEGRNQPFRRAGKTQIPVLVFKLAAGGVSDSDAIVFLFAGTETDPPDFLVVRIVVKVPMAIQAERKHLGRNGNDEYDTFQNLRERRVFRVPPSAFFAKRRKFSFRYLQAVLRIVLVALENPLQPQIRVVVQLRLGHLDVGPGHRAVDDGHAGKGVGLDDRRGIGRRVAGVLQLGLAPNRLAHAVDGEDEDEQEQEDADREDEGGAPVLAGEADGRPGRQPGGGGTDPANPEAGGATHGRPSLLPSPDGSSGEPGIRPHAWESERTSHS